MKQCIMLAAGLSSRMGEWKMMLPWQGATVLDSALHQALAFCDRVILVTGHRGSELAERYAGRANIRLCHNACYQEGMFSSVRCGVAALVKAPFFVVPGDMPALSPQVYAALWQHGGDKCLIPSYEGGKGHPVLLPTDLIADILAAPNDSNLRDMIRIRGSKSVSVSTPAIHWDVDTPEQYHQLQALCR